MANPYELLVSEGINGTSVSVYYTRQQAIEKVAPLNLVSYIINSYSQTDLVEFLKTYSPITVSYICPDMPTWTETI